MTGFFIIFILKFKKNNIFAAAKDAEVVELVDTLDSKSSASDSVRVRVPPSVQKVCFQTFFYFGYFGSVFVLIYVT